MVDIIEGMLEMEKEMVKELFFIKTVDIIKVIGKRI